MKLIWSTPEIDQFTEADLDGLLGHLHASSFSGIEPMYSGKPAFDRNLLQKLLQKNDQQVIGLRTGGITLKHGVCFSHPEKIVRDQAIMHFQGSIQYAREIGAPLLLVGLMQGKLTSEQNYQEARKKIIECLVRCGEEAAAHQITIGLEAINRFTLGYHTRADEIIAVLKEINLPNVRLLLDTFHMNIEESSIEAALVASAPWLVHVHLADNNRLVPGRGGLNFARIIKVLKALGYQGAVSIESDDTDWFPAITAASNLLLPMIA